MYALTHNVRVLRVLVNSRLSRPQLRPVPLLRLSEPLISQHLMTLELKSVVLTNNSMDFSSCPALKNLKIRDSKIWVHKISSQSLSRLSVKNCEFSGDICTQILAPNLSSLLLDVRSGRLPYFPSAVLLVKAYIRLDQYCRDCCWHSNFEHCAHDTSLLESRFFLWVMNFSVRFSRHAQKNYDFSVGSKIYRQKNMKTHRKIV